MIPDPMSRINGASGVSELWRRAAVAYCPTVTVGNRNRSDSDQRHD
jgi:hypothetical protein